MITVGEMESDSIGQQDVSNDASERLPNGRHVDRDNGRPQQKLPHTVRLGRGDLTDSKPMHGSKEGDDGDLDGVLRRLNPVCDPLAGGVAALGLDLLSEISVDELPYELNGPDDLEDLLADGTLEVNQSAETPVSES